MESRDDWFRCRQVASSPLVLHDPQPVLPASILHLQRFVVVRFILPSHTRDEIVMKIGPRSLAASPSSVLTLFDNDGLHDQDDDSVQTAEEFPIDHGSPRATTNIGPNAFNFEEDDPRHEFFDLEFDDEEDEEEIIVVAIVVRLEGMQTPGRGRRRSHHRRSRRGQRFRRFQPSAPAWRPAASNSAPVQPRPPNVLVRHRAVSLLDAAKAAAMFEKYCRALRANDPALTAVTTEDYFPAPFGRSIGDALLGNTIVTSVTLDLTPLYMGPVGEKTLPSLTQFLRESKTLLKVNLYQTDHYLHATLCKLCTVLVKSVTKSPSVQHLTLDGVSCIPGVAQRVVLNLTSLQELVLQLPSSRDWANLTPRDMHLFGAAFGASRTLRSLHISFSSLPIVTAILRKLTDKRSILSKLGLHCEGQELNFDEQPMNALTALLGSKRGLQTLSLQNWRFSTTDVNAFVAALKGSRVVQLSLLGCHFGGEVKSQFVRLWKESSLGTVPICPLRDLVVQGGNVGGLSALAVVSMIVGSGGKSGGSTLGSQLHSLTYKPTTRNEYVDCDFFGALKSDASKLRLEKLTLFDLTNVECRDLSDCLPLLKSVKELRIDGDCDAASVKMILFGVSHNHTLLKVSFGIALDDSLSERLESYLERNRNEVAASTKVEH
jgi:hypothetical protein